MILPVAVSGSQSPTPSSSQSLRSEKIKHEAGVKHTEEQGHDRNIRQNLACLCRNPRVGNLQMDTLLTQSHL